MALTDQDRRVFLRMMNDVGERLSAGMRELSKTEPAKVQEPSTRRGSLHQWQVINSLVVRVTALETAADAQAAKEEEPSYLDEIKF